jgi:hypothetical protein
MGTRGSVVGGHEDWFGDDNILAIFLIMLYLKYAPLGVIKYYIRIIHNSNMLFRKNDEQFLGKRKNMKTQSEVLYFPSIEFLDDSWLKGALCHWDKVYRIVPQSYTPKDSDEVKEAVDAGLVESINLNDADLSEAADKFIAFWDTAPFVPAGFEGYDDEPIRLHPEKVDERIRIQLSALASRIDNEGGLSLSKEVANSYMLFLSEAISRRRMLPKITDSQEMFTAIGYFQQDGNFDEFVYNDEAEEFIGTLTLASLVPSDINYYSMNKVIEFHKKSAEGRAAFRDSVSELIDELKGIKDRVFFEKRIKKFDEELRASRKSLASIVSSGGADIGYAMITAGVPMMLASLGVMGMAGDPWGLQSLGASAFFGVTAALADHTRSRRSQWTSNEASYWLSLHSAFESEGGVHLRVPQFHRGFEEFIND